MEFNIHLFARRVHYKRLSDIIPFRKPALQVAIKILQGAAVWVSQLK